MEFERGIRRSVTVLSGLVAVAVWCFAFGTMDADKSWGGREYLWAAFVSLPGAVAGGVTIWLIFFTLRWIVLGFRSAPKK